MCVCARVTMRFFFNSFVPAHSIYYYRFVKISMLLTCETRRYCSETFCFSLKVYFWFHPPSLSGDA